MFKAEVVRKIFKVLSTVKLYWLEVREWKEEKRERDEEARVFFTNVTMQVACFFSY